MPTIPQSNLVVIGIDPGKSGGIAVLYPDGKPLLYKMPETELDIWELLNRGEALGREVAVIEWIHPAIQGIGKSSMSKLYGSYMALRMALTATGIPFEIVMPKKWQAGLDIQKRAPSENTTTWKNRLKAKAQQLFPQSNVTKDTADALLIAEYYRRTRK